MSAGFLINKVAGGSVISSTAEFDVRNYATRLVLAGAVGGDVVQVQVLAGLNATTGTWANLCYNGVSIQLNSTNTQYELITEGHYRVTYGGGSSTLQVWMEQDTIGLDQRTISAFLAPAIFSGIGATGPQGAQRCDRYWHYGRYWGTRPTGCSRCSRCNGSAGSNWPIILRRT
jgi:hypothetical protein